MPRLGKRFVHSSRLLHLPEQFEASGLYIEDWPITTLGM